MMVEERVGGEGFVVAAVARLGVMEGILVAKVAAALPEAVVVRPEVRVDAPEVELEEEDVSVAGMAAGMAACSVGVEPMGVKEG